MLKRSIPLILLLLGALVAFQPSIPPVRAITLPSSSAQFIWFFNYKGTNTYLPTSDLALSPTQVETEAGVFEAAAGHDNLVLVHAIAYQKGHQINSGNATMTAYVTTLHTYAKFVTGFVGLAEFNLTTSPTIYQVVTILSGLGVDGVWIDQTSGFYTRVGQTTFSHMMDNLTSQNPSLFWMVNYAGSAAITPLGGASWPAVTFAEDSPLLNTYDHINPVKLATLNTLYPGRVLMHFDADGQFPNTPMSLFAALSSPSEITVVSNMVVNGKAVGYRMTYPVFGGSTYNGGPYAGTIYNCGTIGNFPRSTCSSWVTDIGGGPAGTCYTSFLFNDVPQGGGGFGVERDTFCGATPSTPTPSSPPVTAGQATSDGFITYFWTDDDGTVVGGTFTTVSAANTFWQANQASFLE